MRARIKITDLTPAQWDRLNERLAVAAGEVVPGHPVVCAVFEFGPQGAERHAQIPVYELATLMTELALVDYAQAALTPDALPEIEPEYVAEIKTGWPYERYGPAPVPNAALLDQDDANTRPEGADQ